MLYKQHEPKLLKISPKCVCGPAPDPTGGAYSALPDPLAGLRGPTSKGRGREGTGGRRGGRGRGGEGPTSRGRGPTSKGRRGEGRGGEWALLVFGPFRRPCTQHC